MDVQSGISTMALETGVLHFCEHPCSRRRHCVVPKGSSCCVEYRRLKQLCRREKAGKGSHQRMAWLWVIAN